MSYGFIQHCADRVVSPLETMLVFPLASIAILVAIGAISVWLWVVPKSRKWRVIPGILLAGLVLLVSYEPVKLHLKMTEAREILAGNAWKEGQSFEVRGAALKLVAFLLPDALAGRCNSAFIVEAQSPSQPLSSYLYWAYPSSPVEYSLQELIPHLDRSAYYCSTRARILYGDDRHETQPGLCRDDLTQVRFDQVGETLDRGFEMKWCRELDKDHAYCEADWASVKIASGGSF